MAARVLPPRPRRAHEQPARDLWLTAGLLALAGGLAGGALLGPLLLDVVRYPFTETVRNELVGLEAVTLILVVPGTVLAAVLCARAHPAGPLVALPTAGFASYMLVQYVVGPQYPTLQPMVLGHLALFVLSVVVLARAWGAVDRAALATRSRAWALVVAGLAAFVLLRWLPAVAGTLSRDAVPAAPADLTMYWSIFLLDLGLVVPLTVATAVSLARRAPWAGAALYGVVGWFALVPPSVAAMAVVKLVRDDPNATVGDTGVLLATTLVGWGVAAVLFRPALRRSGSGWTSPRTHPGPLQPGGETTVGAERVGRPRSAAGPA